MKKQRRRAVNQSGTVTGPGKRKCPHEAGIFAKRRKGA
jgi:hypothetical protein